MTKYWQAGRVKTRLGQSIGMDRAAALHRLFVGHLCANLAEVLDRQIVCLSPESSIEPFRRDLGSWSLERCWEATPQGEGDLGDRMERWFEGALGHPDASARCAILIGADCPMLSPSHIRQAVDHLRTRDVVLGPACDGGYYLIGLRGPWDPRRLESLFHDLPWSTPDVLSITQQRITAAGLSLAELTMLEDVDTVAELNRLREQLRVASETGRSTSSVKLKAGIDRIMAGPTDGDVGHAPKNSSPTQSPQ